MAACLDWAVPERIEHIPCFQEAGSGFLKAGDLPCPDTDAVPFETCAVDFSRTFLCGQDKASNDQRMPYARARERLETDADLLQPGRSFQKFARKARKVPEGRMASRYHCIGHGPGMSGEFPDNAHRMKGRPHPIRGRLEPAMIVRLESHFGRDRSGEGVELEISETGVTCMPSHRFGDRLTGPMI